MRTGIDNHNKGVSDHLPFAGLKELHFTHWCKLRVYCFATYALVIRISDQHLSLTPCGGCRIVQAEDKVVVTRVT